MERLTELYRRFSGSNPSGMELLPLSGSARKYYRMDGSAGKVIGCIGTNKAENDAFLAIDTQFRASGLHAPEVFAVSSDGMMYIQEDLGDSQLFKMLEPSIASGKYGDDEMAVLHKVMQLLPAVQYEVGRRMNWDICFPDREFNSRMVNFDLNYFKYDFLKFTGLEFNEIRLQDDFDRLCADSLEGIGETFMYRDFQARNIMVKDGEPCFIDFQGGRRGPVQYDLASFLWNAGTHFDAGMREKLERTYVNALRAYCQISEDEFRSRYRLITLVRLLQEMGAYGFRGIFERKQLFIDCLRPAQKCLHELVSEPFARYPYLTDVLRRVADEWEPAV